MAIVTERDWYAWHAGYDNPASGLSRRLRWVQDRIRAARTSLYADLVPADLVIACDRLPLHPLGFLARLEGVAGVPPSRAL